MISNIYNSFKDNHKYITPYDLAQTVTLFRKLNKNEQADELIEFYIQNRKDEPKLFDVQNNPFRHEINDQKLIDEFNKIHQSYKKTKSPKDILLNIAETRSWNEKDKDFLASLDEDTYYKLFKTSQGKDLSFLISASQLIDTSNATKALIRIANENLLNEARVTSLGITLKDNGNE